MHCVHDSNRKITDIEDEAALWVARSYSGELTQSEQEELEQWKQADPAHEKMFDEMRWVWAEMGLITTIIPEDSLDEERDPDILVKALERLTWFGSAPQIVAFIITTAAILILVG